MRSLVIFILLLAAAKIGYQDMLYRQTLAETLVTTYRADAAKSCAREAAARNLSVSTLSWSEPEAIELSVGKNNLNMSLWQMGAELWDANARVPYLLIVARREPFRIVCEFDLMRLQASVFRL